MLVIDPEECIDCGACEPECPVEAIFPEDALPEKWEPFVKINYAFPEGMDDGQPAGRRLRDRVQRLELIVASRRRSARASVSRPGSRRQRQLPSTVPGVLNRASRPRPSRSCSWTIASSALVE